MEKRVLRNQAGFTLIEIIAVLVILGILSAVAVPKFIGMQEDAKKAALQGALAAGASNATLSYSKFILDNGATPTSITDNYEWTIVTADTSDIEPLVAISTDLGDFKVKYTYKVDETTNKPKVRIDLDTTTATNNPSWVTAAYIAGLGADGYKEFNIDG